MFVDFVETNSASSSSSNVHRVATRNFTKDLKDIWLCRIDVAWAWLHQSGPSAGSKSCASQK